MHPHPGADIERVEERVLKALTRAQLEAFNRDGFVKGVRVFADEEIAAIRAYFDALLARVLAAGGDAYSINSAHLSYGRVYDLSLIHISEPTRPY